MKLNKRWREAAKYKVIVFLLASVPQAAQSEIMLHQSLIEEILGKASGTA